MRVEGNLEVRNGIRINISIDLTGSYGKIICILFMCFFVLSTCEIMYASYSRISGYVRLVCHHELFIHALLDINYEIVESCASYSSASSFCELVEMRLNVVFFPAYFISISHLSIQE